MSRQGEGGDRVSIYRKVSKQLNNKNNQAWLLMLSSAMSAGALAATPDAGSLMQQQQQIRDFYQQQQLLPGVGEGGLEAPLEDQTPTSDDSSTSGGDLVFQLSEIVTSPSEILTETEIRQVTAPLEGTQVRVQQLLDAVAQLNALYKDKGFATATAILPPQKVVAGRVSIQLVEGRVGSLQVEGNQSTTDRFIAERVSLSEGDLVQLKLLEESLFYFNSVNDVQLRGVVKPGAEIGRSNITLHALEPKRREWLLFSDNAGTRDVGRARVGLSYTDLSLSGERDQFRAGVHASKGTRAAYASYSRPVDRIGSRLAFSIDYSRIRIIDGPLEPLRVTGDSYNVGVSYTHPQSVAPGRVMNLIAGLNRKKSITEYDRVPIMAQPGMTVSLGFDLLNRSRTDMLYTRHYLTAAPVDLWGNGRFSKYNGEMSWSRLLKNQHLLSARGGMQLTADRLLPSSEQFQIGGISSVRGYPEGLLTGDKGYFASLEYSRPLPTAWGLGEQSRGFAFFDHGAAFPFKGNGLGVTRDDYLTSIGAGINLDLGGGVSGRVQVGTPLFSRGDGKDGSTWHLYFQATL